MIEILCDSCLYGETKTIEVYKPLYTFSSQVHKVKKLVIYCKLSFTNKQKLVKQCEHYRPKSGKIGKKLYQKQIFET